MFNLKAQRQGLLFYPWVKTHVNPETGDVRQNTQRAYDMHRRIKPIGISENTGEKFYQCHLCQDIMSEQDVEYWSERDDVVEKYTYPQAYPQTNDSTMFAEDLRHLCVLVEPYIKKLTEYREEVNQLLKNGEIQSYQVYEYWRKWEVDAPDVINFINSSKGIKDFCQFEQATSHWGSAICICDLLQISDGKLNGSYLDDLSRNRFITDTEEVILEYISKRTSPGLQKLDIKQTVPICEECLEDTDKCEFCDQPIFEDDIKWETTWNNGFVCQTCVEGGRADVCSECQKADSSDDMRYIEGEGNFCEDCAKNLTSVDFYRDRIESAAESNSFPFSSWFPDGENRLSIPFIPSDKLSQMDQFIRKTLNEKGCNNTSIDYQEGYCHYQGRKFKIMKFLQRALNEEIKEIQTYDWSEEAKKNKIQEMQNHFKDLTKNFETSEFRKLKEKEETQYKFRQLEDVEDLQVVITQDPNDIATISGETRSWHSNNAGTENCMSLGVGMYFENVFCYIENGFLAAYLTRGGDDKAEDAIARILIRRLENEDGVSIAVAENSVYGNAPVGFRAFVSEWLQAQQSDLPKGFYERVENAYSDSDMQDYEKTAARLLAEAMIKSGKSNWYKKIKYA